MGAVGGMFGIGRKKKKPVEEPVEEAVKVPEAPSADKAASNDVMGAIKEAFKRRRRANAAMGGIIHPLMGVASAVQKSVGRVGGATTLIGK